MNKTIEELYNKIDHKDMIIKEQIVEIQRLKNIIEKWENGCFSNDEELQQAKDSLQKDYQEARDKIDELKAEIKELTTDNEWWHNRYNAEHKIAFEDFKPKIDKTIEYIKKGKKLSNNKDYDYLVNAEKILEILGEDDNV